MNLPRPLSNIKSVALFQIPRIHHSLMLAALLWFTPVATNAETRTWTDVQGRKIEAELIRASDTEVVVKLRGKEVSIPLAKLSEEDREYVDEWLEENADGGDGPDNGDGGADRLLFDGKTLKTGGELNLFEYEYDEEDRVILSKLKPSPKDTGWKLAIAVPDDFDPTKPQRVFVANTAVNNDEQRLAGNVGVFGMYAPACAASGWICIAYDTSLGRAEHNHDLISAMQKLAEEWPQFRTWEFAVGGFSGGAKACFDPLAFLVKNDYKTVGAFLGGCNDGSFCERAKERYNARSSGFRTVKAFISTGDNDNLVSEDHVEKLINAIKTGGIREIRSEFFEGGHQLHRIHFEEALKWFSEP